jgi:hypothetical protein
MRAFVYAKCTATISFYIAAKTHISIASVEICRRKLFWVARSGIEILF